MRQTGRYSACVVTQLGKTWGAEYGREARRPSGTSSKQKDTSSVQVLSIGHVFGAISLYCPQAMDGNPSDSGRGEFVGSNLHLQRVYLN